MIRIAALILSAVLSFGVLADSCSGTGGGRGNTPRRTGLNQTCFPGFRITVINGDRHTCQTSGKGLTGRAAAKPTCGTGYALEAGSTRKRNGAIVRYGCLRVGSTN